MKYLLLLIVPMMAFAKVDIIPYRHGSYSSWDNSWNESVMSEQKDDSPLMTSAINEADLQELDCPGYNKLTDSDAKKDFWIVFLASLARAESGFNVKSHARATKHGGGSYGLLQLSKATARNRCGLETMDEISDPTAHLRCGAKLLSWQIEGAPTTSGKLTRPDLKGQLFGKHILLWGPLRQNDKRGRKLLVNWFKSHLDQLPFCKA
jgi:hypothetical protein